MNILALAPSAGSLRFEYFTSGGREARLGGVVRDYGSQSEALEELDRRAGSLAVAPDLVALRAPYGGMSFRSPVLATAAAEEELVRLVPGDPLHLPEVTEMIELARRRYRDAPTVLVFETAYFTALPEAEATYGIEPSIAGALWLRRFGYHGIFHQAASASAWREAERSRRILSLCLEPQPEVAGVLDGRPLMVTGGATPLEGLPGERSCGEIDPSIILSLSEEEGRGPEEIDQLLSRGSGLSAIAGRDVSLGEVLGSADPRLSAARDHLDYRILLAAGAAKALLGGIDTIVVSGRYARSGAELAARVVRRLAPGSGETDDGPRVRIIGESLLRYAADQAEAHLRTTSAV